MIRLKLSFLLICLLTPLTAFGGKKDSCLSLRKLSVRRLTLVEILAIRTAAENDPTEYQKVFDRYGVGNISKEFKLGNETVNVGRKLGSGYRAVVYQIGRSRALKVPRGAEDSFAIEIEVLVTKELEAYFSQYGIKTAKILSYGEKGAYLEKALLDKKKMADQILSETDLSSRQIQKLEELWENAKKFARETGIGLDLKASNLWWDGKDWVLFDAGVRTSYRPYGFTVDVPSFKEYLKTFNAEEPSFGQTEIAHMLKNVRRGL